MKIYTKKGDQGFTSLIGNHRLLKSELRLEVYGTLDELNSAIGFVLSANGHNLEFLISVQKDLFNLGSELATLPNEKIPNFALLGEERLKLIEKEIDYLEEKLPTLNNFILPGGSEAAARLHLARTICRRVERLSVRLNQENSIRPLILSYLNRLSDYLFVLARWQNFCQNIKDIKWEN